MSLMKKFNVSIFYSAAINKTVEAEDKDSAIEQVRAYVDSLSNNDFVVESCPCEDDYIEVYEEEEDE